MVANWGFNACLGLTALGLTFFFSWQNNTWQTSLFRALIGFILFFLLGYLFRMLLFLIGSKKDGRTGSVSELDTNVNIVLEVDKDVAFQPVPLTSLHKEVEQENVASTVRDWISQDREG